MTSLLLLALLASGSANGPVSAKAIDCKAERIALMRSIQPTVLPNATEATAPDSDPLTVQFLYIEGLPQGRVSEDGQVLYIPAGADELTGARLFAQALDHLLALKFGDVCPALQVPEGGA